MPRMPTRARATWDVRTDTRWFMVWAPFSVVDA
jgi:hypothetical protein